jgi:hypothetical protein
MASSFPIYNDINSYNNPIILNNNYNSSNLPKYSWFNNPKTGLFNSFSNIVGISIKGKSKLIITDSNIITNDIIAYNITGSGSNITNIDWCNINNIPKLITSNELDDLNINLGYDKIDQRIEYVSYITSFLISSNSLQNQNYINSNSVEDITSFLISSNTLQDQNYINSNSIQDISTFFISSNILLKQNYINSNSFQDILSFLISSNNLYDQNYINSNSIQDITSFLISSNTLQDQNYINSNTINDLLLFLISSNNLKDQNYINSNSIQDITSFLISSNTLQDQNYINSNSIEDLLFFVISSNTLKDQNYINSNSIQDITSFLISSNTLHDQNYINSNSIEDITSFLISSNTLQDQNYINSNSIQDITSFLISSNTLKDQNYINSNSIQDITSFLISSNTLQDQNYINSNSIQDITSFLISSNTLQDQNYINSNSIQDITSFLISSNTLQDQNYINSNSIQDITSFLISSNVLRDQNYINSNSIQDLLLFLISSNTLQDQNYINSNSIQDITSFLISSNTLQDQNYINSNSIQDITSFLISSNVLRDQNYINSNSLQDITSFLISSNTLQDQNYINSNSIQDITSFLISSNVLRDQNYINSNSIQDITSFLISSNTLQDQNYINSNSIQDLLLFLISSNTLQDQNYINSNTIEDLLLFLISSNTLKDQNYINSNSIQDITSFLISSNVLQKQNYINSNSLQDITSFLISSNTLQDQNYINSNSIEDLLLFLISSNTLQDQNYINSNSIEDITKFLISSNNLKDQNYINSNSIEDLLGFYITSNIFEINLINSNVILDITSNVIEKLFDDLLLIYINSNVLSNLSFINSNFISSNDLKIQNYINSNSINDITSFFISSNILSKQNYINSNSITDILTAYFNYQKQTTDIINEGIHNKFIIDNLYNNNLTINGDLTASNLYIIGEKTILNTTTYETEQLQIFNDGTMTSLIVTQLGLYNDVAYFYYNSNNIALCINSNGFIGINKINPFYNLDVNGSINANNFIGYGSNIKNIEWDNLINIPIFNLPITNYNNNIKLLYDSNIFTINNYDELTLLPTNTSFKFDLIQGYVNYPHLWYYQIPISDFSKTVIIDDYEYNIFNLTSWSATNINIVYNCFVIVSTQDNGYKKIKNTTSYDGDVINLGDGTYTTEGWQLDNDINYMTWFSTTPKTIYNVSMDLFSGKNSGFTNINDNTININTSNINSINGIQIGDPNTSSWRIYNGLSGNNKNNSLCFSHNTNGLWWLSGEDLTANNEISDIRIKTNIIDIDNILEKFLLIKPKKYLLLKDKDEIEQYGFIAQDIQKVFPELINIDNYYIPNIMSYASTIDNKTININIDISTILKINDKIKIILNYDPLKKEYQINNSDNKYRKRYYTVKNIISNYQFEINEQIDDTNFFVYGKMVDDFQTLDYNSLFSLHIEATQEIHKNVLLLQNEITTINQKLNRIINCLNI